MKTSEFVKELKSQSVADLKAQLVDAKKEHCKNSDDHY